MAIAIGTVVNETESKRTPNKGATVRWAKRAPGAAVETPRAAADGEPGEDVHAVDGIREELTALHARLDSESDRNAGLNRELGALNQRLATLEGNAGGGRAPSRLGSAFSRLRSLFAKRKGDEDAPPAEPVWDELRRRGPLVPYAETNAGKRIIAVTAFGLSPERLASVLDTVEAYCRKRDTVPVFLTDSDRFELFRERRLAFEYLPPADARARFAPEMQWALYFQRRLSVFRAKWRPAGIISFGTRAPIAELDRILTEPDDGDRTPDDIDR